MRQKLSLSVVLCLVCLFSAKAQTVNESESKIFFNDSIGRYFVGFKFTVK